MTAKDLKVEEILNYRTTGESKQFLVKWEGIDDPIWVLENGFNESDRKRANKLSKIKAILDCSVLKGHSSNLEERQQFLIKFEDSDKCVTVPLENLNAKAARQAKEMWAYQYNKFLEKFSRGDFPEYGRLPRYIPSEGSNPHISSEAMATKPEFAKATALWKSLMYLQLHLVEAESAP